MGWSIHRFRSVRDLCSWRLKLRYSHFISEKQAALWTGLLVSNGLCRNRIMLFPVTGDLCSEGAQGHV